MSTTRGTYNNPALGTVALTRDQSRAVFGPVMGLVAIAVGFAALGAYIGRNLSGGAGLLFFIAVFGCVIGLNVASSRGHTQLSVALLCGLGLFIGLAVAPVINDYAKANPEALWQAAGATGAFVAGLGARLRHAKGSVELGARPVLGAARPDRVRNHHHLRRDPEWQHLLCRGRARDLRWLHDLGLQPPTAHQPGRGRTDRRLDLPRHLQRLPVLPAAVRRRAQPDTSWRSRSRRSADAPRQPGSPGRPCRTAPAGAPAGSPRSGGTRRSCRSCSG
jgi:hypothetical protein